ncbi:MAG: hypothetical protein IKW83_04205 [Muribaculaceae bacterium]|nr:hypothetical protein [Muribaculaceae bacterium]
MSFPNPTLRYVVTTVITVVFSCLSLAQRPAMHVIDAVNDSVIDEGNTLYLYDKLNWVMSDAYKQMCSSRTASLSVVGQLNDTLMSGIMIDVDQMKCVFECRLNLNSGEIEPFDLVRGLTPKEIARAERQLTLLEKVSDLDGIYNVAEAGNLNADVVEISPNLIRVYLLQGTDKSKLIPFGNDYSFDFDADGNLLARRKYHKSFIPIDFSGKDGNIRKCTHSHLDDNPYISPTDIATFLLYGHDLYGMKTFSIYSKAFNCYFTYNADNDNIILVDDEESMK